MTKRTWNVMGPDEIPISPEPFATEEEAKEAAKQFVERFRAQGYYSAVDGRIPLSALPSFLRVYSEPHRIKKLLVVYEDDSRQTAEPDDKGEFACEMFGPDGGLITAGNMSAEELINALKEELCQ